MPQTTVEEKFFLLRADKFLQDLTSTVSKSQAVAEFQEYKGFLKNITGGEG